MMLVTALLLQLATPSPAHAWFGWLDRLSGPGGWWGFRFDARLWCFMEQAEWPEAVAATQVAAIAFVAAAAADPGQANTLYSNPKTWLDDISLLSPARTKNMAESYAKTWLKMADETRKLKTPLAAFAIEASELAQNEWNDAAADPAVLSPLAASPGLFLNASCSWQQRPSHKGKQKVPADRKRALAYFDLGYQVLTAKESDYAEGKRIFMHIIQPRFSWRLLPPPYDFIDAGAGVGWYTFHSEGLSHFHGLMVEAVRFDLHGPPRWLESDKFLVRLLAALHGSFGFVLFPGGFEPDAFNASGAAATRISGGEAVFQKGITFDILGFRGKRP